MGFTFSANETDALDPALRCVEDRRNNPVRNRTTVFQLKTKNMLAYTFPFIPGFSTTAAAVNTMPFAQVIDRPVLNADLEGHHLFGQDYVVQPGAKAKVNGDVFEKVEAAIHWNLAARWNEYMVSGAWPAAPRYARPTCGRQDDRQVAALNLPRNFDWVRLLVPEAREVITEVRTALEQHDLSLPTSTPDMVVVALPEEWRADARFRTEVPDLSHESQALLDLAYLDFVDRIEPGEFLLAIALKKSLRSDRLYQPLYEANIMQLLLEGRLDAPQVDFEVHTLDSAGTDAAETYRAASLAGVATDNATPHRAVRDLYEPTDAAAIVRRLLDFLNVRMAQV